MVDVHMIPPGGTVPPVALALNQTGLIVYYDLAKQTRSKRHPETKIVDLVEAMKVSSDYLSINTRSYGNLSMMSMVPNTVGIQWLSQHNRPGPYHKVVALGRGTRPVIIKVMRIGKVS